MKVVVTGAAGAIGSHLCERLLELGHEVVGIDALTPYYLPEIKNINVADITSKGGKVHILDLAQDNLEDIFDGADFIFHLAAQPGISHTTPFEDYLRNNIIATHKVLEHARRVSNLKGFVHASTSSVYGRHADGDETFETKPTSHYGVTKLAAEQMALSYEREHGLPVTVLRLFSVYGERERPEKLYHKLIKAIHNDQEFPLYEGAENHVRSFTYVKDIVDAFILVIENIAKAIGHIFNVGNDKTATTGEGIAIIENIMGKKAKFIVLPKRVGDQKETAANITKMRHFFGYEPKVSLEEGLLNQVRWYSDKIHGKIK